MKRIELTDAKVRALQPGAKRYEVMDLTPNLGIRVSEGRRVWIFKTRAGRRTLGTWPDTSINEARQKARRWLELIKEGRDPRHVEGEQRAAAARLRGDTFASVAEQYIKRRVAKMERAREVERLIRKELIGRWSERPVREISRHDVVTAIEQVADRAPAVAHMVFAFARAFFNWAINRGVLEKSPCDRLKASDLIGTRQSRSRVLTDPEIKALCAATDNYPYGLAIRLLLITGARRSEVAEARWSEIDPPGALWCIPPERTKTDIAHVIPLSTMALELINGLPRFARFDLLFTISGKPLDDWGHQLARLIARAFRKNL